MVTKEWVAVHRCHHAHCETAMDAHSPLQVGIHEVLWRGAELYRTSARDPGGHASKEAGRTTGWNAKSGIEAERSGPRSLQLFARQLASYG